MKVIEKNICKKCSAENPPYKSICTNCKSYLRERTVNLDLWKTIGQIIESPADSFKQIVYSEHKNFIIFLTLLLALKNLIIARFLSVPALGKEGVSVPFTLSYLMILIVTVILLYMFSLIQKYLYSKIKIKLRIKDVYALNIYSFIPLVLSLIFPFIIEVVVLGGDIFSKSPTPFEIKPTISYILAGLEAVVFLWSLFLIFRNSALISGKILMSLSLTLLFLTLLLAFYYSASLIIFTI